VLAHIETTAKTSSEGADQCKFGSVLAFGPVLTIGSSSGLGRTMSFATPILGPYLS
jgi:hypothetical protein